jgi:hypothetical protein
VAKHQPEHGQPAQRQEDDRQHVDDARPVGAEYAARKTNCSSPSLYQHIEIRLVELSLDLEAAAEPCEDVVLAGERPRLSIEDRPRHQAYPDKVVIKSLVEPARETVL